MQKNTLLVFFIFFFGSLFGQSIEKTWQFQKARDKNGLSTIVINPQKDYLKLENGSFEYQIAQTDSLPSNGDYIFQNNLLILFLNNPSDSIRRFRVEKITDSILTLSEKKLNTTLKSRLQKL